MLWFLGKRGNDIEQKLHWIWGAIKQSEESPGQGLPSWKNNNDYKIGFIRERQSAPHPFQGGNPLPFEYFDKLVPVK